MRTNNQSPSTINMQVPSSGFTKTGFCLRKATLILSPLILFSAMAIRAQEPKTLPDPGSAGTAQEAHADALAKDFGKLPLSFEANRGQADSQVRLLSRRNGYTLPFTDNEADWLPEINSNKGQSAAGFPAVYRGTLAGDVIPGDVTWTWPGHFPKPVQGHLLASTNGASLQAAIAAPAGPQLGTINGTSRVTAPKAPPAAAPLAASQRDFGPDGRLLLGTKPLRPTGLAIDGTGNFVIADAGLPNAPKSHRILRVQASTGAVSTVISGGARLSEELGDPFNTSPVGMVLDAEGNMYTVGGAMTRVLLHISPKGEVSQLAGTTVFDLARVTRPSGPPNFVHIYLTLVTDLLGDGAGNIYFAGQGVSRFNLRTHAVTPVIGGGMDLSGTRVTTPPGGSGIASNDWNGQSIAATTLLLAADQQKLQDLKRNDFGYDPAGNLYLALNIRSGTCIARVALAQGTISCLPGTRTQFVEQDSIAVGPTGDLLVLKQGKIFRYDPASNRLTLLAALPSEYHGGPLTLDKAGTLYLLCDGYIQRLAVPTR